MNCLVSCFLEDFCWFRGFFFDDFISGMISGGFFDRFWMISGVQLMFSRGF